MSYPNGPTNAELKILKTLWARGPQTVRQVHQALGDAGAYTTTLKLMQIMTEKGLVRRDESQRTHVYEAAIPEQETKKGLIADLLDRAFSGSTKELIMQALSSRRATKQELAEIREMIEKMERRSK